METLEVLAEVGMGFTILSPDQASIPINPTQPYEQLLPSGRKISIFFYQGKLSRAVAFEGLLSSGKNFLEGLQELFSEKRGNQLVSIATDGETYGHHHKFGEMALAWALDQIESSDSMRLTHYAEYLAGHPPSENVQILENTSWSCPHGVERWRSDCGCNLGGNPNWNQAWRAPLREALDWLRDQTGPLFEKELGRLLKDPWAARNDYIELILDRSPTRMESFLERNSEKLLSVQEKIAVLKWLEMSRYAMLMYASCGWFSDDISGVETIQVIQCAGRVVELTRALAGKDVESGLLQILEKAKSNLPAQGDGRQLYQKFVRPWLEKGLAPGWISVLK